MYASMTAKHATPVPIQEKPWARCQACRERIFFDLTATFKGKESLERQADLENILGIG